MITMVRIWRKEVKMSDYQVEMGRLQEVVVEITTTQMCLASPFSSMRRRGADITGSVDDFFLPVKIAKIFTHREGFHGGVIQPQETEVTLSAHPFTNAVVPT